MADYFTNADIEESNRFTPPEAVVPPPANTGNIVLTIPNHPFEEPTVWTHEYSFTTPTQAYTFDPRATHLGGGLQMIQGQSLTITKEMDPSNGLASFHQIALGIHPHDISNDIIRLKVSTAGQLYSDRYYSKFDNSALPVLQKRDEEDFNIIGPNVKVEAGQKIDITLEIVQCASNVLWEDSSIVFNYENVLNANSPYWDAIQRVPNDAPEDPSNWNNGDSIPPSFLKRGYVYGMTKPVDFISLYHVPQVEIVGGIHSDFFLHEYDESKSRANNRSQYRPEYYVLNDGYNSLYYEDGTGEETVVYRGDMGGRIQLWAPTSNGGYPSPPRGLAAEDDSWDYGGKTGGQLLVQQDIIVGVEFRFLIPADSLGDSNGNPTATSIYDNTTGPSYDLFTISQIGRAAAPASNQNTLSFGMHYTPSNGYVLNCVCRGENSTEGDNVEIPWVPEPDTQYIVDIRFRLNPDDSNLGFAEFNFENSNIHTYNGPCGFTLPDSNDGRPNVLGEMNFGVHFRGAQLNASHSPQRTGTIKTGYARITEIERS